MVIESTVDVADLIMVAFRWSDDSVNGINDTDNATPFYERNEDRSTRMTQNSEFKRNEDANEKSDWLTSINFGK